MANKVFLATYSLKIEHKKTATILSQFDGQKDFYDFLKKFLDEVFENVKATPSINDRSVLHLALDEPVKADLNKRALYGFLSSGVNEDKFIVREGDEKKYISDPDKDITYRNLFFYIQLPIGKTSGYLIIQKKRDLGAKGLLTKSLNLFLREKGFNEYKLNASNLLNKRVYDTMMSKGRLKKIDFIKHSIPDTIEELYDNRNKVYTQRGTLTTTLKSRTSLSDYWKVLVHNIFIGKNQNSVIELNDGSDQVDEIEFELEFNGKIKTFHVQQKSRTQPDIDVTSDIKFQNNEPTIESLVEVAEGLIEEILTLKPVNAK
ncbi:hypothetical protein ACFQZX_14420 [Mucilaginibacter litoreus]|uniref:DUF4747 family protein n=1 Tax=Mucilaginibacter litoreus TaxID=1048221 RepID=A0ABW3AVK5_9SPHI